MYDGLFWVLDVVNPTRYFLPKEQYRQPLPAAPQSATGPYFKLKGRRGVFRLAFAYVETDVVTHAHQC